jgi:hypothetical protein
VTLPSGDEKALSGHPNLTFVPRVAFEAQKKGLGGALIPPARGVRRSQQQPRHQRRVPALARSDRPSGPSALADLYTHIGTQAKDSLDLVLGRKCQRRW